MARSSCTSCGLRSQHCQCHREASTAESGEREFKLTPTSYWITYLLTIVAATIIIFLPVGLATDGFSTFKRSSCHLEVFVDSISVSKATTKNATTDWNVTFVANNPGYICKASLHVIKSRVYRGDKLISESVTRDYFGKWITGKIYEPPVSYSVFEMVVTPIDGVVWDLRVQVVSSLNIKDRRGHVLDSDGFLILNCGDIPVNLTAGMDGNVKGSLIGFKRPCEYLFRDKYWDKPFF